MGILTPETTAGQYLRGHRQGYPASVAYAVVAVVLASQIPG